jgi:regulator of PEP synthase PpsR (kinase-PPPase family)
MEAIKVSLLETFLKEIKNLIHTEIKERKAEDKKIKDNYIDRFDKVDTKIDKVDTKIDKLSGRLFTILITIVLAILGSTIFLFLKETWVELIKGVIP